MLPQGLSWKLWLTLAASNLMLALCFCVMVPRWYENDTTERVEARLRAAATHFRNELKHYLNAENLGLEELSRLGPSDGFQSLLRQLARESAMRFTLIDADGVVLGDSEREAKHMLNHGKRAELIAAREAGKGTATRQSPTLGAGYFYFALPVGSEDEIRGFVRVAIPTEPLQGEIRQFRHSVWLLALVAAGCTTLLSLAVLRRLMIPLSHLTRSVQAVAAGRATELPALPRQDEVGELAVAFRGIQDKLNDQLDQLHSNNERLATVLSSMDEEVIAVDSDELIMLANGASQKLLDVATGDVIGRPLLEASRSRPLHEVVRGTLSSHQPAAAEFESTGQPRRTLAVRVTCLPGDPCPGAVILLHDTTELRRLENLRQEFVANVSHELKTPLSAIKAYAETLRVGAINDTQHNMGFVVGIQEQANRLHELILDMLQIARIETSQEVFDIVQIPLEPVVRASVAQHSAAADCKHLQTEIECPPEPITVQADKQGLHSIVDNLIDNAVKYTPDGGTISIRWWLDSGFARLEVHDTGIGISDEDQRRIFERFFRSDKARSRELGGTGLGLSIVKHLSQAFGGSVELQSELGKGSRVVVKLPVSEGSESAAGESSGD